MLVTLLAILIIAVGLLTGVGGPREGGEGAAFPAPLEYGVWQSSRGYTGFEDCTEQHQTAKMLAGSESNEEVRRWCRMAAEPAID